MSVSAGRYDVAIVGGGMVGASLALALQDTPLKVLAIEAHEPDSALQPSFDDRTTALGNGARRILETLSIWREIAAEAGAIRSIHVSDAGHFGFARLEAAEHELEAFGYTVSNRHIGAVLWRALRARCRIELACPARVREVRLEAEAAQLRIADAAGTERLVSAALVVAADGAHSLVRQAAGIGSSDSDYGQVAVVANIRTDRPAAGIAYERFAESGPMALLPLRSGHYTVVWALEPEYAQDMQACEPARFCEQLQHAFGWRAGRILEVGRRAAYRLELLRALEQSASRVALIGNAAQALHPVAAQGFNLGLRDAAVLAELIATAADPGAPKVLAQFAARRAADRRGMIAFTDNLVKLFVDRRATAIGLRNLGLLLFDVSAPAKRALARLSFGFGGALPRLSRGLRLPQPPVAS
ncbi:MAG TPA: 2-octaprenyl-6-methoxyphenyl hydroxylase [Steroidobacteraceae bacterium]|jgi:2-octaprenyl-6-methoxyphenol hydroxylase|nr:2-octaprenyl-6-methoxyphenyl hydroxylase [Steroidobacteraceae bacterium]